MSQSELGHLSQTVGVRPRSAPAVRFLIAVNEVALVVRTLRGLHPRLQVARRTIEEEAVHVADVDVNLVDELGADRGPVALQVVQQVVVVAPILRDGVVDHAGTRIDGGLEVAVAPNRPENSLPDILLAGARTSVRAVDELHPVALLRRLSNLAIHLA